MKRLKRLEANFPQRAPRPQRDFRSESDNKMLMFLKYALPVRVKLFSFSGQYISVSSVTSVAKWF